MRFGKYTKRVNFVTTPEQKRELDNHSILAEIPCAEIIRMAIDLFLEQQRALGEVGESE